MTRDEAKRRMNLVRMYYKNMVDAFQPAIDCVDGSEELKVSWVNLDSDTCST